MKPQAGERGVVLEVGTRRTLVLTPGGRFRWIATQDPTWMVGQEVWVAPSPWLRRRWRVAAAAAAALAAAVVPVLGEVAQASTAVVSVDINPSVDLTVTAARRVVAAQGLDRAGQALLADTRVVGLSVTRAVDALTTAAAAHGYLSRTHPVVLLAEVSSRAGVSPVALSQLAAREQALLAAHHIAAEVVTAFAADPRLVQAAVRRQTPVSVGRYLLWQRLHATKPTLTLQAVAHAALPSLMQAVAQAAPATASPAPAAPRRGNARGEAELPKIRILAPASSGRSRRHTELPPAVSRSRERAAEVPGGVPRRRRVRRSQPASGESGSRRSARAESPESDHRPPLSSAAALQPSLARPAGGLAAIVPGGGEGGAVSPPGATRRSREKKTRHRTPSSQRSPHSRLPDRAAHHDH